LQIYNQLGIAVSYSDRSKFERPGRGARITYRRSSRELRDLPEPVVWMSQDSREAAGPPSGATEEPSRREVSSLCLTRLREAVQKLIEPHERVESWNQVRDLLHLQAKVLEHYIRLQEAERKLSRTVARRRPKYSSLRQVEWERQRLARELHTDLGQLLTSIRLQVELTTALYPEFKSGLHQALGRIASLSDEALARVRAISRRLHPPSWLGLTLENAIEQLWEMSGIGERFDSRLSVEALPRQPGLDAKILLYRAAQEAVSNVIRHSGATHVTGSLESRGDRVVLRIEDNGVGFNSQQVFAVRDLASGIGLRAIREQAEALGGSFHIESGAGAVRLEVSVPWEQEKA